MIDRPQARDLPLDAHLHTDLSPDSDVPIDAFAAQAVERGHRRDRHHRPRRLRAGRAGLRLHDVRAARADRPRGRRALGRPWRRHPVRRGDHLGQRWEADIRDHLATHAYDFVIGSVHVYRDSPYAAANVAAGSRAGRCAEIVAPYFDEVAAGARSGLFDAIGHIDFVKRYLVPHVTAADLAAAPELYEPILRALVESGRRARDQHQRPAPGGRARPTPRRRSSRATASSGAGRVTVGSDAHRADTFAWALDDGYASRRRRRVRRALTFRRGGASVAVAARQRT